MKNIDGDVEFKFKFLFRPLSPRFSPQESFMFTAKMKPRPSPLPSPSSNDPLALSDTILEELRPACRRLQDLLDSHRRNYLLPHYEIGELVIGAEQRVLEMHGSIYGGQIVDHLADAVGRNARTVRSCVQVAETFSREEYLELISCEQISWAHILLLLSAPLPSERANLIEKIKEHGWTPLELEAAVRGGKPNRRPGGGRRHAVPRNVPFALHRLAKATDSFCGLNNEVLFGEDFDIPTSLHAMASDDLTSELRDSVESAAKRLDQLAADATENARRLRAEGLVLIDEVLSARRNLRQETKEDSHDPN
jgi:hypothetical protein